jgi:hypothetical protein
MALRDVIQTQVKNALSLLGREGLAEKITYTRVTAAAYDPATGVVSPTSTSYASINAVLAGFAMNEKDDSVAVVTDRKALIAYTDLPFEPSDNDWFQTANGDRWEVRKVLGVPGDSLHKLHVRRT